MKLLRHILPRIERLESLVKRALANGGGSAPSFDRVRLGVTNQLTFASASPSPLPFLLLQAGNAIRDVGVVIQQGFDDPAATITVGTLANPQLIVPTIAVNPQVPGDYRVPETHIAAVNEPLFVFITPGASTMGIFRVYFSFQLI